MRKMDPTYVSDYCNAKCGGSQMTGFNSRTGKWRGGRGSESLGKECVRVLFLEGPTELTCGIPNW